MNKVYFFLVIALLASCARKPKACIEDSQIVETNQLTILTSCSEDAEFLTWEFSDNVKSTEDRVQRLFSEEKDYQVTVTAYAKGGYRSSEAVGIIESKKRYVSEIKFIGYTSYTSLTMDCFDKIELVGTQGSFTEEAPYISYVYPDQEVVIEPSIEPISVYGTKADETQDQLILQSYNFETHKDNPIVMDNGRYQFEISWRYKD